MAVFSRALALFSALAVGPAAWACGYHNPGSINRGILNWIYPNSLHVTSAVWRAQLDGVIRRSEPTPVANALVGYGQIIKRFGLLQDGLTIAGKGHNTPAFSIVLLGPVLWSRFSRTADAYAAEYHNAGPSPGDVVVVTDAPVIEAIVEGRLAVPAAEDQGLIRYYGPEAGIEKLRDVLRAVQLPQRDHIENAAAGGD